MWECLGAAGRGTCLCVSCLTSSCPLQWAVHMTQLGVPWLWAICCPVPKSGPMVTCVSVCVCVCVCVQPVQRVSKLGHQSAGFPQHCSNYSCSPLIAGVLTRHGFWFEQGGRRGPTGMFITVLTTSEAAAGNTNVNTNMWAMTVWIRPYRHMRWLDTNGCWCRILSPCSDL